MTTINGSDSSADSLTGGAGNDLLYGKAGDDTLNGGTGIDTLYGGLGNDTFIIDDPIDLAIENTGEGLSDWAWSSVSYTLVNNVEYLDLSRANSANVSGTGNELDNQISGSSGNNSLYGLDGNDSLSGGAGNDTLYGGAGDDQLRGETGTDALYGGIGNDTYYIESTDDRIFEISSEGVDTAISSAASFTLDDNVEILTLQYRSAASVGYGNSMSNTITGNTYIRNNALYGLDGNDTITGEGTLFGGNGDDCLYGGLSGFAVMDGGAGNDLLSSNSAGTASYASAT